MSIPFDSSMGRAPPVRSPASLAPADETRGSASKRDSQRERRHGDCPTPLIYPRSSTVTHPKAKGESAPRAPLKEPVPPFKEQQQQPPGRESELQPAPRYTAPRYRAADKLKGLAALITGGDSGIGRAVAVLFAREGADVAISYLPEEQADAEETRRAVEECGRRCELLPGDLRDARFCDALVEQTVAKFRRLDVLVSNAAQQRSKSLDQLDDS
jgi:hypothetical protein